MRPAHGEQSALRSRRRFLLVCVSLAVLFCALYFPFRFGGWTEVDNGWTSDGAAASGLSLRGVPAAYETPCSRPGTVVPFTYTASLRERPEVTDVRTVYVYLPYGYETREDGSTYDVLYLLHGSKDSASSWLVDRPVHRNVVDNLIARGEIRPLIIVTPDLFEPDSFGLDGDEELDQFAFELREQIIPAVENAFACATLTEEARSHRLLAGVSRGALAVFRAGLTDGLDLFSRFGVFSGMLTDPAAVAEGMERPEFRSYAIDGLYAFNGFFDYTFYEHGFRLTMLDGMSDRITKGENYEFFLIEKGEHTWPSWEVALYDFLLLACPAAAE